ncbi:MAG: hypothetical protein MJ180_00605 [Candidatus Gastranaerophilales bacterium]|nr:hypothetical protein [Candidatus Gastranaerophilales bacterium]
METILAGLMTNPVFSGYLDLGFLCALIYLMAKVNALEEKLAKCEFDQKDDIKDIKDKITKIENNISTINQNIIELAGGRL